MFSAFLDPKLLGGIATVVSGGFLVANLSGGGKEICTRPSWVEGFPRLVMDCKQNGKHYQVNLVNTGPIDKAGGGISLQLFDVTNDQEIDLKGSGNQFLNEKGQWVQTLGSGKGWRIFQNASFFKKIHLMTPNDGTTALSVVECQVVNVRNNQGKEDLNENLADIRFRVTNCSKIGDKEVCDLTISTLSNKLEWTPNFKPQVSFCNRSHHQEL